MLAVHELYSLNYSLLAKQIFYFCSCLQNIAVLACSQMLAKTICQPYYSFSFDAVA